MVLLLLLMLAASLQDLDTAGGNRVVAERPQEGDFDLTQRGHNTEENKESIKRMVTLIALAMNATRTICQWDSVPTSILPLGAVYRGSQAPHMVAARSCNRSAGKTDVSSFSTAHGCPLQDR